MTAFGELFVDETCRDEFQNVLDTTFGRDTWKLDGSKYNNIWNESDMPRIVYAPIVKDDENVGEHNQTYLGLATIQVEFNVGEDDVGQKYIYATPTGIKIDKIEAYDLVCMQCEDGLLHSAKFHTEKGCLFCSCRVVNIPGNVKKVVRTYEPQEKP